MLYLGPKNCTYCEKKLYYFPCDYSLHCHWRVRFLAKMVIKLSCKPKCEYLYFTSIANRILDEESFINALKEDQGRSTNVSLFDEIRLSICNKSCHNNTEFNSLYTEKHIDSFTCDQMFDFSYNTIGTQTINIDDDTAYCVSKEIQTNIEENIDKFEIKTIESLSIVVKNDVQSVKCVETQTDNQLSTDNLKTYVNNETQTEDCINYDEYKVKKLNSLVTVRNHTISVIESKDLETIGTQTINLDILNNNSKEYSQCENKLNCTNISVYEDCLNDLQKRVDFDKERNDIFESIIDSLKAKIGVLETACAKQKELLDKLPQDEIAVIKLCDVSSIGTQAEVSCQECERRNSVAPYRRFRKYFWTPLKCLFQIFALVCFICAISILYGVSTRARPSCPRDAVPWSWVDAQEIMDMLLRIEYGADVPM